MSNEENKYIAVAYRLYSQEDGTEDMVEEAVEARPFWFITGLGMTLDRFEAELLPLARGDRFNFVIPQDQAYGAYDEAQVVDLPRSVFEVNGRFDGNRVYEGAVIPMITTEGQRVSGSVSQVRADAVVMDFNHPLAGCDLRFDGQVLINRPATNEEITQALRLMTGQGGGCGGCGGGDCGGGDCGSGGCGGCGGC